MNKGQAEILIVEDERIVAMDIAGSLKSLGYQVSGMVTSGQEALKSVEDQCPDLILMDIRIKGDMDGIQTTENIQERHDIPIIYLTAYADEKTLARAKITEPYGYIIKPFDKKILYTIIEMALYKNRMERKLKQNEKWLSTTLYSIGDGVIATDALENVKLINRAAQDLTGYTDSYASGKPLKEVFVIMEEETGVPLEDPVTILLSDTSEMKAYILRDRDGNDKYVTISGSLIEDARQHKTGVVLVFADITTQRNAEREREKLFKKVSSAQERLRILSKRLLDVQEAERRHIARELHDEIGQILTAIKINLQTAFKLSGTNKIEKHITEGVELVEEAIQHVRKLSIDLRPSMLDDLGLVPALRWYIDRQAQRFGFNAKVIAEGINERLPSEVEITCFRISQEALNNIIKHAKADYVEIKLFFENNDLHLQINDNGAGFVLYSAVQKGLKGESMGLLGMQERVELAGGKLKILSKPGSGTTVHAIFPADSLKEKTL